MTLTSKQKQELKAQAHSLKPVILIGSHGLTEAVLAETDRALDDHELIKVKVAGEDRDTRQQIAEEISLKLHAHIVQIIGRTLVLYRVNPNKKRKA